MPDIRLIDANALKRLIKSGDDLIFDRVTECEILHMIDYQETIDAQPVKHGHWGDYGSGVGMYCSECKHRIRYRNGIRETTKFSDGEFEFVQYASKNGYYNFCPKCGAKMDGDADEQ